MQVEVVLRKPRFFNEIIMVIRLREGELFHCDSSQERL